MTTSTRRPVVVIAALLTTVGCSVGSGPFLPRARKPRLPIGIEAGAHAGKGSTETGGLEFSTTLFDFFARVTRPTGRNLASFEAGYSVTRLNGVRSATGDIEGLYGVGRYHLVLSPRWSFGLGAGVLSATRTLSLAASGTTEETFLMGRLLAGPAFRLGMEAMPELALACGIDLRLDRAFGDVGVTSTGAVLGCGWEL